MGEEGLGWAWLGAEGGGHGVGGGGGTQVVWVKSQGAPQHPPHAGEEQGAGVTSAQQLFEGGEEHGGAVAHDGGDGGGHQEGVLVAP